MSLVNSEPRTIVMGNIVVGCFKVKGIHFKFQNATSCSKAWAPDTNSWYNSWS